MKAREFTINIPINIKINGDGEPVIDMGQSDDAELDLNPIMVPPLQQDLELKKADLGKSSPVIDKLTQDQTDIGAEPETTAVAPNDSIQRIKQLIQR